MQKLSDERILDLISSFYAVSNETSQKTWHDVFLELSGCFSSGPGSLSFFSPNEKRFDLFVATMDPQYVEEYNNHYYSVSPFRTRLLQMKPGERLNRGELIADSEFERTEIYQKHFKRQDVFHYEHRVLFQDKDKAAGISFSRPKSLKNFNSVELRLLNLLVPHLQKSLQLFLKFSEIKRENAILTECFESVSQTIAVVDHHGKVVFMNERARRLIESRDGLTIDHQGILTTSDPNDFKKLRSLIKGVFEPVVTKRSSFGGVSAVGRSGGRRPLSVFVTPFSGEEQNFLKSSRLAMVFINDPTQQIEEIEPVLSRIYRLTPAESKIAVLLTEGKTLKEAGDVLGITQNTIRTHLKRIFSKTETNRQSELIKLILNTLCSGGRRLI